MLSFQIPRNSRRKLKAASFRFTRSECTVIQKHTRALLLHVTLLKPPLARCFFFFFFQGVSLTSFTSSSKIQTLCPLASLKHDNRLRPQEVAKHTSTLGLHLLFFFFCRKYCFTEYMLVFFSDDRISDGSLFFSHKETAFAHSNQNGASV